jgi:hypothetical protein
MCRIILAKMDPATLAGYIYYAFDVLASLTPFFLVGYVFACFPISNKEKD